MKNKVEALEIILTSEKIEVVCLTEHHLTSEQSNLTSLKDYKLCSVFCRMIRPCGGSAIFCKESLVNNVKEMKQISDMSVENVIEMSAIEISSTKY